MKWRLAGLLLTGVILTVVTLIAQPHIAEMYYTSVAWWIMAIVLPAVGYGCGAVLDADNPYRTPSLRTPRRPSSVRTPTPGLLSPERFAGVCASYATPAVDPEPELPDPLPLALRDPAFRERQEALDALSEEAETARVRRKSASAYGYMHGYELNRNEIRRVVDREHEYDRQRDELLRKIPIAERRFTHLTHCPRGHVAEHWVGDVVPNTDYLERTCRFTRCGATWLEGR